MEVLYQKILTALLSFFISFLVGSIPVYLAWKVAKVTSYVEYSRIRTALSLLSCLSAGVFLGTCLLELFPEVQISLIEAFEGFGITSSFPFAQFVTAVGFFIVITIETLFFSFHGLFEPKPNRTHAVNQSVSNYGSTSNDSDVATLPAPSDSVSVPNEVFRDIDRDHEPEFRTSRLSFSLTGRNGEKPFRAATLFAALSLHTFFEGLACGMEPNHGTVWQFAIALCIHKPLITSGINISFLRTTWGTVRFVLFMSFLFSAVSSIAIGIGIIGIDTFDVNTVRVITGLFQGLASGAFLYVVFLEVLPYEMASHAEGCRRLANLLALAVGFGITVAMETAHVSKIPLCHDPDN